MASIDILNTRFCFYGNMYSQDLREQSFADWPFREECNCTPEKGRRIMCVLWRGEHVCREDVKVQMARAGFIHCPSENEPDVASCFFCLIELEGWEPDDDPWTEHVKRSPNCGFLTMKKDFTELTVGEYYVMEKKRLKVFLRKVCHKKMAYLRDEIDQTLEILKSQFDSEI